MKAERRFFQEFLRIFLLLGFAQFAREPGLYPERCGAQDVTVIERILRCALQEFRMPEGHPRAEKRDAPFPPVFCRISHMLPIIVPYFVPFLCRHAYGNTEKTGSGRCLRE